MILSTLVQVRAWCRQATRYHYNDVIMGDMASQITSLTIVYSIVYSDADQRKHQSSASLAFVRGIHRSPVSGMLSHKWHKWPVTRKKFPFDDVIMITWTNDCSRFQILATSCKPVTCRFTASPLNTLRPGQNGRQFADDIFSCIFLNENFSISNNFSLKYVPWGLIDIMSSLVQKIAWRRIGDKPLSEPMMV